MSEVIGKSHKIAFKVNEETVRQLEEIQKSKYPRASDRATVLRWLIQDVYEQMIFGKEVREPLEVKES